MEKGSFLEFRASGNFSFSFNYFKSLLKFFCILKTKWILWLGYVVFCSMNKACLMLLYQFFKLSYMFELEFILVPDCFPDEYKFEKRKHFFFFRSCNNLFHDFYGLIYFFILLLFFIINIFKPSCFMWYHVSYLIPAIFKSWWF